MPASHHVFSFRTDSFLKSLLLKHAGNTGKEILKKAGEYKLQIIYILIDRDAGNNPSFQEYHYHVNPESYFYPASTVKMPIAFTALEKLNKISFPGLNRDTPLFAGSFYRTIPDQPDDTFRDGLSVAQYIKEIFLVSNNDASNMLYEFIGQQELNQLLHKKGYEKMHILHRLDIALTEAQNRDTAAISFRKNGETIYSQPPRYSQLKYPVREDFIGKGYIEDGKLIPHAMAFSMKNKAVLSDLIHILQSVIFPGSVPSFRRFDLSAEDFQFLYRWMSAYPQESGDPQYDSTSFPPGYVKFLLPEEANHGHIRVFNKSGWAYGFMTDVAYIADFRNSVEFMLAATLYANRDDIPNGEHYEYETIAKPFLKELGKIIYQYELNRERKYLPDLSRYNLSYEEDPL
ncbi:MAG: hypothetical protein EPN37_02205 [Chitinophagaceae bacterium]|nr:MAG: hypothetical protein EPN37_02205 [Chitinophagaceae bacterium]